MAACIRDEMSGEIACAVAASAWSAVPGSDLTRLRASIAASYANTLTPGTLKHADEQSLVALLTLKEALDRAGLSPADCKAWGLVAAPRAPGRKRIADSIARFAEQGAWSVSPHIIPHCSLHSLAGLLSQALRLHGPNIGAGGLAGAESEALWAALALLEGERLSGVWVVLTGWDREGAAPDATCLAAVLGLRRAAECPSSPRLSFITGGRHARLPRFTLESLGAALAGGKGDRWDLGGAVVTLRPGPARLEAAA